MSLKVLLIDPDLQEAKLMESILNNAGYFVTGISGTAEDALLKVKVCEPDLVVFDLGISNPLDSAAIADQLKKRNIPFVYSSPGYDHNEILAIRSHYGLGYIQKPYTPLQLILGLEMAMYNHTISQETIDRDESAFKEKISQIFETENETAILAKKLIKLFQRKVPFDYVSLEGNRAIQSGFLSFLRIGSEEYQKIEATELSVIAKIKIDTVVSWIEQNEVSQEIIHLTAEQLKSTIKENALLKLLIDIFDLKAMLSYSIKDTDGGWLRLTFFNRHATSFDQMHLRFLNRLQGHLTEQIRRLPLFENVDQTPALQNADDSPQRSQSTESPSPFEGIIGQSRALTHVFELITQVSNVNTSVLLLGESGTGKECIAKAIHTASPRHNKPFIKVNCTALPAHLIESELFGYEKGAFTGAVQKHLGKFERAHGGTIFLDEIGDMPFELQAKLLRVIQEREIERLGGTMSIKIDVRIIAATNLDLKKQVSQGKFRHDLYFRLNVFPILLPPLRDRKDDIALLIRHFLEVYNVKCGKDISEISQELLNAAQEYDWPGNIRELENLTERAVLLTKGTRLCLLDIPQIRVTHTLKTAGPQNFKTIFESEREHIISALHLCNGKVWGFGGAAELLKLPPTTLNSRMKKLGIKRHYN